MCSFDTRTGEITPIQEVAFYNTGQPIRALNGAAWNVEETLLASVYERIRRGFLNYILVLDTHTNELANIGDGMAFDWKPHSTEITALVGNGEIRTYSTSTRAILAESEGFTAPINMIALRPDSYQIASTGFGYEQNANVWDMGYSWTDPLFTFDAEPAEIVEYIPDGSELIAGGTIIADIVANQSIDAFDPDTGDRIRNIAGFYEQGSSPPRRFWSVDYQEYAELDSNLLLLLNGPDIEMENDFVFASWSPDGAHIATVTRFPDDYSFLIHVWDATTGEYVNVFASGMYAFRGLVWSPESTRIAVLLEHPTGSNIYLRGVRIFTVAAGEDYLFDRSDYQRFTNANIDVTDQQAKAAWNSDSTMLVIVLPDVLEIHTLQGNGTPLVSLPAYGIVDLEWSGDDRFIVAGSEDGTIRIWGVPAGQ